MPTRKATSGIGRAVLLVAGLVAGAAVAGAQVREAEPSAEPAPWLDPPEVWMERMTDALLPGDTMRSEMRIVTRDAMGGGHDRATLRLDFARREGAEGVRMRIEVEAPEEGRGTLYQIVDRPGQRVTRWVFLPRPDLVRRIEGVHRTDPFLGTEFTYEDLALLPPEERMSGTSRRVSVDGRTLVEVESDPYHYYDRVVTRIDPETRLPVAVHFYDTTGLLYREQYFEDVRTVGGHPFPHRIRIRDRITGTESVLAFRNVEFGGELPPSFFDPSVIERRMERLDRPPPEARR